MFKFPDNLYTDIRIENSIETNITIRLGQLIEAKTREYTGVFVRLFDGAKWYYRSFVGTENIQNEINKLTKLAKPNINIMDNPIVLKLQVNKEESINFNKNSVADIPKEQKINLLKSYFPILNKSNKLKNWDATYTDFNKIKEFYSSKGANIKYDIQGAGFDFTMNFAHNAKNLNESFEKTANNFSDLNEYHNEFQEYILRCEDYVTNSESVEPGDYTVVFSPFATGVFAHESFGHKSESDFFVGSQTVKETWPIGKTIGIDELSIIDNGDCIDDNYVPFDDEGTKSEKTYLIKNGKLNSRLHNATTSVLLYENLTCNARAINYKYEPIVRMTNTYIAPGKRNIEEILSEVKNGVFIDTIYAGGGMRIFTIVPRRCYKIENGKITTPINVSVVTGDVLETMTKIDAISNDFKIVSSLSTLCGKPDQFGLRVGLGGPYIRIKSLKVN